MKCDVAQEQIVLLTYGELDDEFAIPLEHHLSECEACRNELSAMQEMADGLALTPVVEPSPNLLAQSRVRLDEALDAESPHGLATRLRANWFRWAGFMTGAPALATLLVGVGFLAGDFTFRYQAAKDAAKKQPRVTIFEPSSKGSIANVSGIVQTPNSELVQVKYNRVIPESVEGSLDDPNIRQLLMVGLKSGASEGVRTDSATLLAGECLSGHACSGGEDDGKDVRNALVASLRGDKDAGVRMKALEGLQRFVGQDENVRDAVALALLRDPSATVRKRAIGLLEPVQSDSSVRQVLRTVSTQDENQYIRTASFQALQGAESIQ